ncbi:DUF616 domain-containing protein [Pontimonas sp.]|nr:DUF616 domain-containing protein [Pontimonas sp.]
MKMPRDILCYTSEFGNFEAVWDPITVDPQIEYSLISDSAHPVRVWRRETPEPQQLAASRLANRTQKMLYRVNTGFSGVSVYIDANVRLIRSLLPAIQAFMDSGADIGLYRHYVHTNVRDEAAACIKRGKVSSPAKASEEINHYRSLGFPDDAGLWEGSVIFKNHSSEKLAPAMNEWWDLYSRFQTRDQFSLPFVIWKHELSVFDLDSHSLGREHYFVRLQHSQAGVRNRMARYLQARAPENRFWAGTQALARRLSGDYGANE